MPGSDRSRVRGRRSGTVNRLFPTDVRGRWWALRDVPKLPSPTWKTALGVSFSCSYQLLLCHCPYFVGPPPAHRFGGRQQGQRDAFAKNEGYSCVWEVAKRLLTIGTRRMGNLLSFWLMSCSMFPSSFMLFPSPVNPWWNRTGVNTHLLPGTIERFYPWKSLQRHVLAMQVFLHVDNIQGVLICCHLVVLMSGICYIPWGSGSSGMEGYMSCKSGVCPCTTL